MTRFSGTLLKAGRKVIDKAGTVGSIIDIRHPSAPPRGQHWSNEPQRLPIRAAQVGQVFGIALDDANPPNVYLTATSAFGLHRNADNSDWMEGMWGPGGGPGSVWKLSAADNYKAKLFTDIHFGGRANSGAALGNIVFDKWNKQLFVSDLETGMIYRIALADGAIVSRFDHGTRGRINFIDAVTGIANSLAPVSFNPSTHANIQDCHFGEFAKTPSCWNFADFRRRVWGLGIRRDRTSGEVRLYYAIWGSQSFGHPDWLPAGDERRNSVWSIRLGEDGNFDATGIRREFHLPYFFTEAADILRAGPSRPVVDIAFPECAEQNIMIVAERGGIRNLGLDKHAPFSTPHESRVIRYRLDKKGIWRPEGRYGVGRHKRKTAPLIHANASGGIAFGFGYSDSGYIDFAKPDRSLWMSGDALCSANGPCFDPATNRFSNKDQVHGVQGMEANRFTPLSPPRSIPPEATHSTWMIDADVNGDPNINDATEIGDIAIYQPCERGDVAAVWSPPGWWQPPSGWSPPGWWPQPPPACPRDFLRIDKSSVGNCEAGENCTFRITFTNVAGHGYNGPIFLFDTPPAGSTLISSPPHWNCHQLAGNQITCTSRPPTPPIPAGGSVNFDLVLRMPADLAPGRHQNCVQIVWPTDPAAIPGGDLAEGGTWEIAWVEIALAQRGLLDWAEFDGVYEAGNPADPTQHAIDTLLGTAPGTGTLTQAQAALFIGSSALHQDCNAANDRSCVAIRVAGSDDPAPDEGPEPETDTSPEDEPLSGDFDLQVEKTGPEQCNLAGTCEYTITIRNNGPADFRGPLFLQESFLPRNSVLEGLTPDSWRCVALTSGSGVNCRHDDVSLPAGGEGMVITVRWRFPMVVDRATTMECATLTWPRALIEEGPDRERNTRAWVEWALALQGLDPGPTDGEITDQTRAAIRSYRERAGLPAGDAIDDTLVESLLPQAALGGDSNSENDRVCLNTPLNVPVNGLDLEVEKTGPESCAAGEGCRFEVTVKNNGPATYRGPLHLIDHVTSDIAVSSWGFGPGAPPCRHSTSSHTRTVVCRTHSVSIGPGMRRIYNTRVPIPEDYERDSLENCAGVLWPRARIELDGAYWPLKMVLSMLGYGPLAPNNALDERTRDAIQAYRRDNGLPDSRDVDEELLTALFPDSSGLNLDPLHDSPPEGRGDLRPANNLSCVTVPILSDDIEAGGGTTCQRGAVCNPTAFLGNTGRKHSTRTAGIRGTLTPGLPIQSVTGAGWSCTTNGASYSCLPKALNLKPGQRDVLKLSLTIPADFKPNTIRHDIHVVWPNQAARDKNPKNDSGFSNIRIVDPPSAVTPSLTCQPGWKPFTNAGQIPPGWQWTKIARDRRSIFCARPCPTGFQWNGAACIQQPCGKCERRSPRTRRCEPFIECRGGRLSGKKCLCPPGALRQQTACGQVCKPRPPLQCGRCERPDANANRCVRYTECVGGNLYKGQCICPKGTQRKATSCGAACKKVPCTGGRHWIGNRCLCPRGLSWNGKHCINSRPRCGNGRFWNGKACVCRKGQQWRGGRCIRPQIQRALQLRRQGQGPY